MVEQDYALYVKGNEKPIGVLKTSTLDVVGELARESGSEYGVKSISSEKAQEIRDSITGFSPRLKELFAQRLAHRITRMEYREIETAPEDKELWVVWGENSSRPEYGRAVRAGVRWYKEGEANPHANGMPCANPDGWLPLDKIEWTKAEKRLCDILASNPHL